MSAGDASAAAEPSDQPRCCLRAAEYLLLSCVENLQRPGAGERWLVGGYKIIASWRLGETQLREVFIAPVRPLLPRSQCPQQSSALRCLRLHGRDPPEGDQQARRWPGLRAVRDARKSQPSAELLCSQESRKPLLAGRQILGETAFGKGHGAGEILVCP